ncbi:restriction system modified-DNA reader domain-containing protein [Rothia kristinae]
MSTTPVNVQIPSDAEAPIIADFVEHALRVAYIDRSYLLALPAADWDRPGIYILLSTDGSGRVYVGQARRLRGRLIQHNNRPKLDWRRAVAVQRDTTDGFNTAEIGYLEGRVSAEIGALEGVTVVEGQKSGDETLPRHMMLSLDSFVKSTLAALRLAGMSTLRSNPEPAPEDESASADPAGTDPKITPENPPRKVSPVAFPNLVSSGMIRAGQTLHLTQGGRTGTGTVTADGEILVEGLAFKSPSSAAAHALGLQSSNGWTTWHIGNPDGPLLDTLRRKRSSPQSQDS